MKLSNHAIDRPRVVLMAALLVVAVAFLAALNIPIQRTPAISKAVILVAVTHPGAQPSEVEEQITRKIEEKLQKLKNVDFIASTSMRGSSITQVIFLDGVEPDQARGDVKDLVDEVRRELPIGREVEPIVSDIDFDNVPLMLVNMFGPEGFDERSLKKLAEEVQEVLEDVQDVSSTQLFGGREREIHVDVQLDLAMEHGVTLRDVASALTEAHAERPGGSLETGGFEAKVVSGTKLRGVEDIRQAQIPRRQGQVIRVGDVAQVHDTYRRIKNVAHLDGNNCATIIVYKETNSNTLRTAKALRQKVEALKQQYPNIQFSITRNTSDEISIMFRVLGSSFVFGAMLVLIILGWVMGLRISMLVLMAIPFSSAVGLTFLYFFEVPISNMVIFSFILVLGMVVDGAIIVAENIHRHIENGEDPVVAAKTGIAEVGMPVIMADLTTIAAYLPMLLVPGIMGDFMGVMPLVVSVSLFGSILVDHFLIPAVAALWFRRRMARTSEVLSSPSNSSEHPPGDTAEPTEDQHTRPALGYLTRAYVSVLQWSLNHRWAIVSSSVMALAWAVLMLDHLDFTFFPPSDRGQFEVKYELPLGYSIEETIAASKVITDPLLEMQKRTGDVVHFVSAIGSSEGLASRLENDPAVGPEFGTVMVQLLSPLDRQRHETKVIRQLRAGIEKRIHRFPGMKYSINQVEEGPPGGADVAIRLTGDDHPALGRIAEEITLRLKSVSGTLDASSDYRAENPEIVVQPNPAVLPFFDITEAQIAEAVQTAIHGDTTIELSLDDEDITLRLQASASHRGDLDSIQRLKLTGTGGRQATIGDVAELKRTMGVYAINRYQRNRAVVARCDVEEPTKPDKVFKVLRSDILPELGFRAAEDENDSKLVIFVKDILRKFGIQPTKKNSMVFLGKPGSQVEGMRATFTGENEERDKNFTYLVNCMAIAVVLIFAILVLQFNSFRQSVVILLAVPLSFVGVVFGMWVCNFPFSLATFIGLVSLAGVVVNDAIVVVDFINQSRRRGLPLREAILEAGTHRLRPVLLTTVTTIGGLLPLFLNWSGGAEFWQPLCGAIVFGLAFATVLTLVVIPVSYSLIYNRQFRSSLAAREAEVV